MHREGFVLPGKLATCCSYFIFAAQWKTAVSCKPKAESRRGNLKSRTINKP